MHKLPFYVLATGPYFSSLAFYLKMAFLTQSFPFTTLKTWFGTNIYLLSYVRRGTWSLLKKKNYIYYISQFSSVSELCRLFVTPWSTVHQASLSITNSQSLLKLMSIESVMPSNCLILCHSLLLLPSVFPNIRVFSSESVLHIRWPKYWSFSFSISPSNECSGLFSFRADWFDLLAVQGTLKSLLQHYSSKAILCHSAFFIVQVSHP